MIHYKNSRILVNALDLGVINDGKTDCSKIINKFLSDEKNIGTTLVLPPKGEYHFTETIMLDSNLGICLDLAGCIIHSTAVPCIHIVPLKDKPKVYYYCYESCNMSEKELRENLINFYAYDTCGSDFGVKDDALRKKTLLIIRAMDTNVERRFIADLLKEEFLSEEALSNDYEYEDVREFLYWYEDLESHLGGLQ